MSSAARDLARATRQNEEWIWSVCFEITEQIYSQIPAFGSRSDLRDASTASSADVVERFLEMLAEGQAEIRLAPGAKARGYIRLLVERRIGSEDLAAGYRIGVRTFWARWSELLADEAPPAQYADALRESTRYILAWADVLTQQMIALHAEERSLWNRDPEAVRHETIRAILDGNAPEVAPRRATPALCARSPPPVRGRLVVGLHRRSPPRPAQGVGPRPLCAHPRSVDGCAPARPVGGALVVARR